MNEFPQPPEKFLRRQHQKRHLAAIWAALADLRPGMSVLDIGSGPGILAAEYAAIVNPGVVYALEPRFQLHATPTGADTASTPLPRHAGESRHPRLSLNVPVVRPNLLHVPQDAAQKIILPETPDIVFLTDILHHAANPAAILAAVRAVCGAKTRILVTEYNPDAPGLVGPPQNRRIAKTAVLALLRAAAFAPGEALDSADEHYAVLAAT